MIALAFQTSNLYKEAIIQASRNTFIDGTIKTTKGTIISIENDIVDMGSCYVTNQCTSNNSFVYGSVFAAEAGITLKTEIDRYSLYKAEVELNFNILLSGFTYEKVPLGVFYINDAQRIGKNVTIKAYDKMVDLEEELFESTTGTAYELLSYISTNCGVELAQSQEEILLLPNGDLLLTVIPSRVGTYRDLLSLIATVTCTYACIDRYGKLKLVSFSTNISRTIEAKLRSASSFSDFETYHSAITAKFLVNNSFKQYTQSNGDEGLLYNMGEVPVIQGTDETNQACLNTIFNELSKVKYTPCDITFNGDPSIDLGDMIKSIDRFGNEILSVVTFFKWTYRGRHQIKSAGSNPRLSSSKEKVNVDLDEIQSELDLKDVPVYVYTNAKEYKIKGGDELSTMKEIAKLSVAANKDTISVFIATICFEMDLDGIVELVFLVDGLEIEGHRISQYCNKGKNIITFTNYISCRSNSILRLSIVSKTVYFESALRINNAIIETNKNISNALISKYRQIASTLKTSSQLPVNLNEDIEYETVHVDTTTPTMIIGKYQIRVVLFGQGLAGEVPWDGTLAFEDVFKPESFVDETIGVHPFDDILNVEHTPLSSNSFNEAIGFASLEEISTSFGSISVDVANETI